MVLNDRHVMHKWIYTVNQVIPW